MCDPITIAAVAASAAISIGTTVMGNNQQNKMIEQGAKNANIKTAFDYQQLTNQATDTQDAAAQEAMQRQLQTARQRGQIAVAQGDAGVGGNSSLMVLNNTIMQERMDMDVLDSTRSGKIRSINATMQGTGIGATAEAGNAEAASMGMGSQLLSAGMSGVNGGIAGYSMGKSLAKIGPGSTNITPALKTHGTGFGR